MDDRQIRVFAVAAKAMALFKNTFDMGLSVSNMAELSVAVELDLKLTVNNRRGFDLIDTSGKTYQVKHRAEATQNIDINNFDFDYLVLVHLGDDCLPLRMWKARAADVQSLCARRDKFRKFQLSQAAFKKMAQPLQFTRLQALIAESTGKGMAVSNDA